MPHPLPPQVGTCPTPVPLRTHRHHLHAAPPTVRTSAPMCCPPTLTRHPCRPLTLYVPLPLPSTCHCRCPLRATAAALPVPPPPPSPYHPHRPLHNTPVAVSLPPPPPSNVSMPPGDTRLVVPDMRHPTCMTPPRRCPTHRCMVPPVPCHIHCPRTPPHSPPFGALCPTLLPLACPHALRTSPTHTHVPPGSDHPHGPPTPPPSRPGGSHAPPTCHCPHRRANPPTDASIPPPMRHAPQGRH